MIAASSAISMRIQESEMREMLPKALTPKQYKILLVEDDPANILVETTFLDGMGYSYDIARTSDEVIEKFSRNSYSLILMDLSLPGPGGLAVTQQLRALENNNKLLNTPIIAITAHAFPRDREKCFKAGMNDYLSKPFSYEAFKAIIEEHIA